MRVLYQNRACKQCEFKIARPTDRRRSILPTASANERPRVESRPTLDVSVLCWWLSPTTCGRSLSCEWAAGGASLYLRRNGLCLCVCVHERMYIHFDRRTIKATTHYTMFTFNLNLTSSCALGCLCASALALNKTRTQTRARACAFAARLI